MKRAWRADLAGYHQNVPLIDLAPFWGCELAFQRSGEDVHL